MDIRKIEAFLAYVRTGSVRKATRRIGVSPAHVMRMIRRLEHDIESPLLRPYANSFELTLAGVFMEREGDRLVAECLRFREGIRARGVDADAVRLRKLSRRAQW